MKDLEKKAPAAKKKRDKSNLIAKAAVALLAAAVLAGILWTLRGEFASDDPGESGVPEASGGLPQPGGTEPPRATGNIYNRTPVATADPGASGNGAAKAYRVQTPEGAQPCRIYVPEGLSESVMPGGLRFAPSGAASNVQGFVPVQFSWTRIDGLAEILETGRYDLLDEDDPYWSQYGYTLLDRYDTPGLDGNAVAVAVVSFRAVPKESGQSSPGTDYVIVVYPSERGLYFIGEIQSPAMAWLYTANRPDAAAFARAVLPEA